jgi:AraC-like DNA-binding protein
MSFVIKGISGDHFRHIDQFFLNGFESPVLQEHTQTISHAIVEGHSQEWYFDGIRMGYSDWHFKKPVDLQWQYDVQIDMVTLQANLKGSVLMEREGSEPFRLFGNSQHNLFYANAQDSNEGILQSERLRATMFFIQFTKSAFLQLAGSANEALSRFCEAVLNGQSTLLSPQNLPLEAAMLNLIRNIVQCRYSAGLKKMYLLSKSIEFLVLQAEASNATFLPAYQYLKTAHDEACIRYARDYIMGHLEMPPSLSELARIVGINEYKLKRGFKEVFGNTVFGYLTDARLDIAKNDLLESKKPVADIAAALGYSSLQHFSYAFKKKFGYSPGKLRR